MKTIQDDLDHQQREKNPFYRFLLANRPYCEICSGPYPSTRIIKHNNRNTAVCDSHFIAFGGPKSETKQRDTQQ